jgi:hypothetical protein
MMNRGTDAMTTRTKPTTRFGIHAALAVALLAGGVSLSACKKEEPPPPPPPPPRKVAQKVDAQSLVSDPRVQFPQEHAPTNETLARAVADLASALAKGDNAALASLLDGPSKQVLAEQVANGSWGRETANIEVVRVVALTSDAESASVTLAVQDPRGAYLLAWKAVGNGEDWTFGGAPSPDTRAPRASDLDNAAAASEAAAQ